MDGIRWLHLSDLHCGQRGEKTRWPTARESFLRDLRTQCEAQGAPDLIVVTGDLAFSGQKREYEKLRPILDEIDAATGTKPLWITIPGNHDLHWPAEGDATAKGLRQYDEDPALRRAVHSGSDTQRYLRKLFSDYERFFKDRILSDWQARQSELSLTYSLGQLPGSFLLRVQKNGIRFGLVGLNSAYLQLGGDDLEGKLCVEPEQLKDDLPRFVDGCDAAILLLHHPPSWLSKRSRKLFEQDIYPPGRFVACLFGHMHGHKSETVIGSSGEPRRYLQGSSLFGLESFGQKHEERVSGYSIYELRRTRPQEGILLRKVRTAQFLDDGALRMTADPATGHAGTEYPIKLSHGEAAIPSEAQHSQPLPQSTNSNPFVHSGRITDPRLFVGRTELLRRIFDDLRQGMSRALVGPAQIGKSSLLSMVCALAPLQLPQVTPVYLNLQLIDSDGDFFAALCHKLGFAESRGYKLERQLAGRRVVLCLDEIEKLRSDRFPIEVREQLRGLADGADAPLTLLLASRVSLAELFPDAHAQTSPLYNICPPLSVPPFSVSECRELLAKRLQGTGVQFSETELSLLCDKSQGHPATLVADAAALFAKYRGQP
ncbi:MAG TPA: metallophosphoesterase [Pseudomonadota bacterium]|nr:metallophosphoesterase [Pseudomonadota bacterium]